MTLLSYILQEKAWIMKRKRQTEEQIAFPLRHAQAGPVADYVKPLPLTWFVADTVEFFHRRIHSVLANAGNLPPGT